MTLKEILKEAIQRHEYLSCDTLEMLAKHYGYKTTNAVVRLRDLENKEKVIESVWDKKEKAIIAYKWGNKPEIKKEIKIDYDTAVEQIRSRPRFGDTEYVEALRMIDTIRKDRILKTKKAEGIIDGMKDRVVCYAKKLLTDESG
jgi:hypothetical protein